MKTILLVLAAAGLSGCAVYPVPVYEPYGAGPPYVVEQPVYIYGGGVYRSGGYGYPNADPRGYNQVRHDAVPRHPPRPRAHDRDRDGVPDRLDRDRDGDGVPDRSDREPNAPRRR